MANIPADSSDEFNPDDFYGRPSKSQVKREMLALQDLGKQLVDLSNDQLKRLPLSEELHEAIRLAQRTTSREGRRRQVHYVGKLMRKAPAEAIRNQLDIWKNGSRAEAAAVHRLEALRDLLMQDDRALTQLIDDYPGADAKSLHSLVRNARQEAKKNAALLQGQEPQRKHYRALFQALKQLDQPEASDNDTSTDDE